MDTLAGCTVIPLLQAAAPWLVLPMIAVSSVCSPEFLVVLAIPLTALYGRDFGIRLCAVLAGGIWLADVTKNLVQVPRPSLVIPNITAFQAQSGFGFPSTHTVVAVCFFGLLASAQVNWTRRYVLLLPIPLVAFSRVFLGVHSPIDVLGGILIGVLLLLLLLAGKGPLTSLLRPDIHPMRASVSALAGSLGMVALSFIATGTIPVQDLPPGSFPMRDSLLATGLLAGACMGGIVASRLRGCTSWQSTTAGTASLIGPILLIAWGATRHGGGFLPGVTTFCGAFLLGAWITGFVPAATGWFRGKRKS